jgi:hypothetical protein
VRAAVGQFSPERRSLTERVLEKLAARRASETDPQRSDPDP